MPSSSVHGGKKQVKKAKNRVTLLGCCNTSGSYKLPLAFVHKSARHRCFKTAVCYFSQRKAWLDTALLETWFHEKFVPHIKKFCQDEGNDFCFLIMHRLIHQPISLPPEMARLQPSFYHPIPPHFCSHWISGYLKLWNNEVSTAQHYSWEQQFFTKNPWHSEGLTIREAVYWASQAVTIQKSWKKLISSGETNENGSSDNNEGPSVDRFVNLFEWLGYAADDASWQSPQQLTLDLSYWQTLK